MLTLDENKYPITLERIEKPRLLGWSNILRGKCEISINASNDSEILLLLSIFFIEIKNISSIKKYISQVTIDELYTIKNVNSINAGINKKLFYEWYKKTNLHALEVNNLDTIKKGKWIISSSNFVNFKISEILNDDKKVELKGKLPGRLVPFLELPSNIFKEKDVSKKINRKVIDDNSSSIEDDEDFYLQRELENKEALKDLYGSKNLIDSFPHQKQKIIWMKLYQKCYLDILTYLLEKILFQILSTNKLLPHKKNYDLLGFLLYLIYKD